MPGPDPQRLGPLADQDLEPVDRGRAPLARASAISLSPIRRRRGRRGRPPASKRSGSSGQLLERILVPHADRGAVDDQLVAAGPGLARRRRRGSALRERPGPARRRARAVRFQTATAAPSPASAQTAARAEPPAPSTSAARPATGPGSAASSPVASVLSARIPPPAKLSVLAAPISRAASDGLVRERQRRLLVRDGDVDADESLRRAAPCVRRSNSPGLHVDRLVAPLAGQPERLERGVLHRRASGSGRPGARAPRAASPPRRSTAAVRGARARRCRRRRAG